MINLTREQTGGILFLSFCAFYGYTTAQIPDLPIDKYEAMSARSMPYFLAVLGALLSILLIVTHRKQAAKVSPSLFGNGHWRVVFSLFATISVYGLALDWLGFLVSTTLFLMAGFFLLGEKRPKVLLGVSIPIVAGLWLLLTLGLDIYLAPGRIFSEI